MHSMGTITFFSTLLVGLVCVGCGDDPSSTTPGKGSSDANARGGSSTKASKTSVAGTNAGSVAGSIAGSSATTGIGGAFATAGSAASGNAAATSGTIQGQAGTNAIAITETLLIDDFEDNDDTTKLGGRWYTYDDRLDKGISTVTPPVWTDNIPMAISVVEDGPSSYAVRIAGTTGTVLTWDYFGMLVGLGPNSFCPDPQPPAVTLAAYRGVRFKAKGTRSGGTFTLLVSHRKDGAADNCSRGLIGDTLTNWGDYQVDLTSRISNSWSTITVDFRSDLKAPAWGKPAELETVLSHAKDFVWQYQNGTGGTAELWLDDIELYR